MDFDAIFGTTLDFYRLKQRGEFFSEDEHGPSRSLGLNGEVYTSRPIQTSDGKQVNDWPVSLSIYARPEGTEREQAVGSISLGEDEIFVSIVMDSPLYNDFRNSLKNPDLSLRGISLNLVGIRDPDGESIVLKPAGGHGARGFNAAFDAVDQDSSQEASVASIPVQQTQEPGHPSSSIVTRLNYLLLIAAAILVVSLR